MNRKFPENIFSFWKLFFSTKKKLRKKLNHHIDVEFCQESIFRILGPIWQLLDALSANIYIIYTIYRCQILGGQEYLIYPVISVLVFFPNAFLLFRVAKSLRGCEKSIPDKILHRNDDPIFFSTFIFSSKKIILKIKKIIFRQNIFSLKKNPNLVMTQKMTHN